MTLATQTGEVTHQLVLQQGFGKAARLRDRSPKYFQEWGKCGNSKQQLCREGAAACLMHELKAGLCNKQNFSDNETTNKVGNQRHSTF